MNKISRDAAIAFASRRNFRRGNTEVTNENLNAILFLYGHPIAGMDYTGKLKLSSCGYRTRTTKERLNAVLRQFWPGGGIFQSNGEWFYYITGFPEGRRSCWPVFFDGLTLTIPNSMIDEDV